MGLEEFIIIGEDDSFGWIVIEFLLLEVLLEIDVMD